MYSGKIGNSYYIYILFSIFGFITCNNLRSDTYDDDVDTIEEKNIYFKKNDLGKIKNFNNKIVPIKDINKSGEYIRDIKDIDLQNNAELYNDSNSIEAKFSIKYPIYRIMFPGCCFEGQCKNKKCLACDDYAWSPMSTYKKIIKYPNIIKDSRNNFICKNTKTEFNLGEEIRNAKCPLCDHFLENIKGCGFSKSIVKIETNNGNGEKKIKTIDTSNEGKHFVYQKIVPEKINEYLKTNLKIDIKVKLNKNNDISS